MRPTQSASCGTTRGFTLLEMLIVVTLIGIVVALVAPRIDLTRYRIETAMQSTGMTLLSAQRYAVTRQHDVIVVFDVAAASLRVHFDADNNGAVGGQERVRNYPLGEHVIFGRAGAPPHPTGPEVITFRQRRGGLPAVTFHRNGSASEFGGLYITSRRAQLGGANPEDTRFLRIERATGRTSWFRYRPPSWVLGF